MKIALVKEGFARPESEAAVEEIGVLGRNVAEDGIEHLVQDFEPRRLGVPELDDDGGALRRLDARGSHRLFQRRRAAVFCGLTVLIHGRLHRPLN